MDYEDLLVEKKDGIVTITLNAPDKLNALSVKMRKSLVLARDEVAKDDEVRVVIVTGAGRGFCSGIDISGNRGEQSRYDRLKVMMGDITNLFPRLDKPTIAAVNGVCVGLGLSIALSCDIRIASEKARFGSAFIMRGLVPDTGATYFLPRVVGTAKALELMYTGELINAADAERFGIVSQVISPDELMNVVWELAIKIAQQPPLALELTKRVVYRSMIDDLAHHLDWETWAQQYCFQSEDHKESVRAFLEKRPLPKFTGK